MGLKLILNCWQLIRNEIGNDYGMANVNRIQNVNGSVIWTWTSTWSVNVIVNEIRILIWICCRIENVNENATQT